MSASFTPLKALDPTLVRQLKETLPAALFEKLNGSLSIDQDRLKFAEYKNRVLEERLRLVRIDKYGPGSEKLSDAQLELLELEPGVSSAEVKADIGNQVHGFTEEQSQGEFMPELDALDRGYSPAGGTGQ